MKKHGRDNRPYVKPVEHIELSEKNIKLRWFLIILLLSIAVVAIVTGLMSALSTKPGWQTVEASSDQPNCSMEFTFQYDFSDSGSAATAHYRQLSMLYTEAAENAYRIFSADVLEDGLNNLGYLNAHLNEVVSVEPELYKALSLIAEYDSRYVYLAPAYVEYNRVFLCETDGEAALYDPARNPETAAWLGELARYAGDPEMIRLEIMDGSSVRLNVSQEYLAFAQENEIDTLLDFSWMRNAFIADYLAQQMIDAGFTKGYLVSYDGFTRNLDAWGGSYSVNIFDRQGMAVNMPARMHYTAPASIVFLRDYPMDELDRWHYYAFESGEIVTAFLDPADGMSKSALRNMVTYSADQGCAEVLLQTAPVFIGDVFDSGSLSALKAAGIHCVWCEDGCVYYNDAGVTIEPLSGTGMGYSIEFVSE